MLGGGNSGIMFIGAFMVDIHNCKHVRVCVKSVRDGTLQGVDYVLRRLAARSTRSRVVLP